MEYESTATPLFAMASLGAALVTMALLFATEVPAFGALRSFLYSHTQKLMFLVAGGAMSASLFYSEVVGFEPCHFCWFQRIAMYPIAIILAVALVSRDRIRPRYIVTLAVAGLAISTYHYQYQLFPDQAAVCSGPVSCSGRYVNEYGFITIPFMAGCGFLSILLLQIAEWRVDNIFRRWNGMTNEAGELQQATARA